MSEYSVIELNILNNECNIIYTCSDDKCALDFLNKTVNNKEEFKDPYYVKYIDSETCISIFRRNWFFPKTLLYRYFIKVYK